MSINKVTLLGNACGDPRVTTFEDGGKVATFSLATNEKGYITKEGHKILDSVEFHRLVVKRKGLVEVVESYVKKGSKLYVEGKIKSRNTCDAKTQELTTVYEIIVEVMELCGTPSGH